MNISLNPTYLCNLRCDFCYLSREQLGDPKRIDIDRLNSMLSQFSHIDYIDLYGGEISALPRDYQQQLFDTIRSHYSGPINLNTNLIKISPLIGMPGVITSVSFDGPARGRWETTLCNMAMMDTQFAVLILCSPEVIEFGAQDMMDILSGFHNIVSVEIKPYSANQSNDLNVSHVEFEEYVKYWIQRVDALHFTLENANRIKKSLSGNYNAFSDDHVYITPSGKFAVLEFDLNDREFFMEMDTLEEFKQWTQVERNRVVNNSYCGQCEFVGRCLTEHYRHVDNVDQSCNGFYRLLKWYNEQNAQDTAKNLLRPS